VLGEPCSNIFPVEISRTKTICALKDAIKEKKQPAFDRVPADSLLLWNASIPVDDSLQENINKVEFGEIHLLLPN
jgi:hypothetical protein